MEISIKKTQKHLKYLVNYIICRKCLHKYLMKLSSNYSYLFLNPPSQIVFPDFFLKNPRNLTSKIQTRFNFLSEYLNHPQN
jgi:hypothetical protein